MSLTQSQIQAFAIKAREAGLDDNQIKLAVAKKEQELRGTTLDTRGVTVQPEVDPNIVNTIQPTKNNGNFITNTAKALVQPAVDYGKFVGESVAQASRVGAEALAGKQGIFGADELDKQIGQLTRQNREILAQMKAEKDKEKKKELAVKSREIDAQIEDLGNKAREIGEKNTTFLVDEEKIKNRKDIALTGAKATAGAAAYAVPASGGVKSLAAAGAASGALSGFSQEDATLSSVANSALVGGAIGGAFGIASKAINKIKKMNTKPNRSEVNLLSKVGQSLREDATQISVAPSVYGAKKEKLIQKTLDELGIIGGPSEKYEQLQPAMEELSSMIDDVVRSNPNKNITVNDLTKNFAEKLSGEVRSKTLTSKVAKDEINGYLNDLVRASTTTGDDVVNSSTSLVNSKSLDAGQSLVVDMSKKDSVVSLKMLVKLKKLANEDYGRISDKLIKGNPLTDREKVAFYARQTLDEAIINIQPEIKNLTVMQSHLFDAARPLASARNTVPTFRVFGITIPKQKVLQDYIGRGLISFDKKTQQLLEKYVDPATNQLKKEANNLIKEDQDLLFNAVSNIAIVTGQNMSDDSKDEQNPITDSNYSGRQQNDKNSDLENGAQNAPLSDNNPNIIPQQPTNQHPIPKFREFATKDQMIASAFADGLGTKDVQELAALWDQFAPSSTTSVVTPQVQALLEERVLLSNANISTAKVDAMLAQYGFDTTSGQSDGQKKFGPAVSRAITQLEEISNLGTKDSIFQGGSTTIGKKVKGVGISTKKATDEKFAQQVNQYNSSLQLVVGAINQMMGAGTLNEGEATRLLDTMPNEYTSEEDAKAWFNNAKMILGV